jgi:hypothetical protein
LKHRAGLGRSRFAVTLLLILISLFTVTSLYYYQTPYNPADLLPLVNAAPTISISPTSASPPILGPPTAPGTTLTVTGSGFAAGDAGTCTITGSPVDLSTVSCTINSSGVITAGSFKLLQGTVAASAVTITVQGITSDSATFNINVVPHIVLLPTSGAVGVTVALAGAGFAGGAATCAPGITGPAVSAATCTENSDGTLLGGFTVAGSPGSSFVTVTDSAAKSAFASFTTAGAPGAALNPVSGPIGTSVTITGSGWNSLDSSVSFSKTAGPSSNLFDAPTTRTCTVSGGVISGCSFTVSSTALGGLYTLTFTGTKGDSTTAQFLVIATLFASPSSGGIGTGITLTGSGYTGVGACTPTFSPDEPFSSSTTCAISAAGTLSGSITVAATANGGSHIITITSGLVPQGVVSASFTVNGAQISLSPNSGPVDTSIVVTGSNFQKVAGTCTISGTPVAGSTCTQAADGSISGAFTILETVSAGTYVITVLDQSSVAPVATALLTVIGPVISLTPTSGSHSTSVTVTGSGFAHTAGSCTLSGTPVDVGSTCTQAADGSVSGTFTVKSIGAGSYFVNVQDTNGAGYPTASAIFVVTGGPVVTLSPTSGPTGTTVTVSGSGWNTLDTYVTFTTTPTGLYDAPATRTCSVSGGNIPSCSFVVSSIALGQTYTLNFVGSQGDTSSAQFTVVSSLALSPTSGPRGTLVTLSGSGYKTAGACTPTYSPDEPFQTGIVCNVNANGILSGSFTVANTANPGVHTVTISSGTLVVQGTISTTFTVTSTFPTIALNPPTGPGGTVVTVTGSGFNPIDVGTYPCITSTPLPNIVTLASCTFGPTGQLSATSFTVSGGAALGAHTIRVQGTTGDFALATFTVTTVTPRITITPATGPTGITVSITASGFSASDVNLNFVASPNTLTMGTTTCPIFPAGSGGCTFTSLMTSTTAQAYMIIATGDVAHDTASALFVLATTPSSISVSPSSGPSGTLVSVSGTIPVAAHGSPSTGYTYCTIGGGSGSGISISTSSCQIISFIPAASGLPAYSTFAGSFIVGNQAPGTYTVRVTGGGASAPSGYANYVEATFVLTGPQITLNPSSGGRGLSVAVTGSGFSFADNTCSISGSNGNLIQNNACAINGGTGVPSGGFIVGSLNPGTYSVRVTGNTGDFAEATFTVVSGPSITLTPSSGAVGITVSVTGSGFFLTDSSCSISGTGGVVTAQGCSVNLGSGAPSGSFVVGNVVAGSYTITLSANGGDFAQAVFSVTTVTPGLTLYPSGPVTPGTSVTFTATGLLTPDTGCSLQATPSTIILSSPTCRISSTGVATGSFVVSNLATADKNPWTIRVVGSPGGDAVSGSLSIIPVIYVTPASGTVGTQFSFTGLGFSSAATSCHVSISPGTWSSLNCGVTSNGQVSGSFTAGTSTAGTYPVTVTDNAGFTAVGFATIGSPTASITISPNVVTPGMSGGISGSGFNAQDSSCSITPSIFSASTCSVSGGVVAASFTVSSGTAPGLYIVTLQGTQYGDFASNFLAVVAVTTVTSTTSTITTFSSSTTTSTTTTSTGISTSFSTSTISTTGVFTQVFTQVTVTTVSGLTSTTIAESVTLTSTLVSTTGTTTTITTTSTIGGIVQPRVVTANSGASLDGIGLLAMLLLLLPFLLRRLLA